MNLFITPPVVALLPTAPKNGSPVPSLTSLYHKVQRGPYGDARYPGNCSGELIKDLLRYFQPHRVFDTMTGSGTCADVCTELGIDCHSTDLRETQTAGADICDPQSIQNLEEFDFVWIHPPYWRMKVYSDDPRDLSQSKTLTQFLERYTRALRNCVQVLTPGGHIAILMGDYSDREEGFVSLTHETKRICFELGLRQACTDIIRFSHGASSAVKTYQSSFIPGLHDMCMIFRKP